MASRPVYLRLTVVSSDGSPFSVKLSESMDIREKMRADWDRRARIDPRYWVAATAEADEASYDESALHDTAALLEGLRGRVGSDARVLDLGCGIGRLSAQLAGRFTAVIGVDVSPGMIEVARALHGQNEGLRFEANSGSDLSDFESESLDLVFSYSVLPHLPPDVLDAYFREVGRVLKPGGWFRFQFWLGDAHPAGANDTLTIRVYDRASFQNLIDAGGFEVAEIDEIDYVDPVLELKPVWVNAQRTRAPQPRVTSLSRETSEVPDEERELEFGLLLYLAVKLDERGEVDEAQRVLEQCVSIDPTRPEAYIQWARHRFDLDDLTGGLKILEALNNAVPDCAHGWLYRAQFAEAAGERQTAAHALDKLAELRPSEPELKREAQAMRRRLRTGR